MPQSVIHYADSAGNGVNPARHPRLLHLIGTFEQGGTERQAVQLVRWLHDAGDWRLHVSCLDPGGPLRREIEALGYDIPEFSLNRFYDARAVRQLLRFVALLRARRIEILHTHDFYTNIFGMAAGALARVPVRIASRRSLSATRTRAQSLVEMKALSMAHAVIANSDAVRRELLAAGYPRAKTVTIPNGIDPARVAPSRNLNARQRAERFGLPTTPGLRFVTIVANLRLRVKDIPTFLKAAQRVHARFPDSRFVVAGEGGLERELRELAGSLGISDSVFFIGRCDHVGDLLALSEAAVLCSASEGLSNAILEYMAAGLPSVVTDVGGAREAITDGYDGFVVPPADPAAIADRIALLLADPEHARIVGERARRAVEQRFSCQAQVNATRALYERLLADRGRGHVESRNDQPR